MKLFDETLVEQRLAGRGFSGLGRDVAAIQYRWDRQHGVRTLSSIARPSEPFKLWLAKVGYERVKEIENPELATERTRALYKAKAGTLA